MPHGQQNNAVNKVITEPKPSHWQHRKGEGGNYQQPQHFSNKPAINTIEFVNNGASTSTAKVSGTVEKKIKWVTWKDSRSSTYTTTVRD